MFKNIIKISLAFLILSGCKKSTFVDANIDPTVAYSINPENQFLNGSKALFGNENPINKMVRFDNQNNL